jgi:rod shape-determining protein MreD
MHWIALAILTYAACVLQTTLMPLIAVQHVRPDLLVFIAVFYALSARKSDALLACWIIGFAGDLCGLSFHDHSTVGLHALIFGFAALATVQLRELVFREHLLTYVFFVVGWILVSQTLEAVFNCWALRSWARLGTWIMFAAYTAAYSLVLAPYVHWALKRARPLLGLDAVRTYRVRS